MMRKRIILWIGIAFATMSSPLNAQNLDLDIRLNNQVYPLVLDGNNVVMAASMSYGLYPPGIGMNLQTHPDNNGSFLQPEFLVLHNFIAQKVGNKAALLELYDPDSKELADEKIDIVAAQEAYQDFDDFELLSKSRFGDFVRIRYNLKQTDGDFVPWVLMIQKIGGRYYLNETMPLEHLFIQASSCHPYNLSRDGFEIPDVTGMLALSYLPNGLELTRTQYSMLAQDVITIFLRLHTYSNKELTGTRPEEIRLLEQMKEILSEPVDEESEPDNQEFLELWNQEEKLLFSSHEFYATQIQLQREFYSKVQKFEPQGYLKAGNRRILFYHSIIEGQRAPLQVLPLVYEDGRYRLTSSLGSYDEELFIDSEEATLENEEAALASELSALGRYYGWEILNLPDILAGITQFFHE